MKIDIDIPNKGKIKIQLNLKFSQYWTQNNLGTRISCEKIIWDQKIDSNRENEFKIRF